MEDSLYFAHLSNREGGEGGEEGRTEVWSKRKQADRRMSSVLWKNVLLLVFFLCVWSGGYLERSSGIYVVKQRSQPQFSSVQFENNVLY